MEQKKKCKTCGAIADIKNSFGFECAACWLLVNKEKKSANSKRITGKP